MLTLHNERPFGKRAAFLLPGPSPDFSEAKMPQEPGIQVCCNFCTDQYNE